MVIVLAGGFFCFRPSKLVEAASSNADQVKNFNQDITKASEYWAHNKLGSAYFRQGDYEKSIVEYQKAIQIIESSPDEYARTDVSKEYMNTVNHDLKVQSQIFSRYGLIDSLDKAGRYEEAIQNIEWLQKNQVMKGKEEFLKQKLDGMKQNILQKIKPEPNDAPERG